MIGCDILQLDETLYNSERMKKIIPVTVIVPVYNVEKYVGECLNSIVTQSLANIEVLCVDDGSIDNSPNILRQYAAKYDCIKVLTNDGKGAAAARNLALKRARGEYIAFMDSDDKYPDSECLRKLYKAATENKAKIVVGSFSEYDYNKNVLVTDWPRDSHAYDYKIRNSGWIYYKDWQMDFGFVRAIYNRKFLSDNKLEFPLLTRHEDPVFFVAALMRAEKFYGIKDVVYWYRLNYKPGNLSDKNVDDAIIGISTNLSIAIKNGYSKLEKWCIEFMHWTFEHSPHECALAKTIDEYRIKNQRLENDINDLKQINAEIEVKLNNIDEYNKYLKNNIDATVNSRSYRIGCIITSPIRLARKCAKKNK